MNVTTERIPLADSLALPGVVPAQRRPGRGWLVRRALVVADLVGLGSAFLLAQAVSSAETGAPVAGSEFMLLATFPLWVLLAKVYGLYDRDEERAGHTTIDDLTGVFHLVTVGVWLLFATLTVTGLANPLLDKLVIFWLLAVVLIVGCRVVARRWCRSRPAFLQRTVIVGAGDVGQLVAHKILGHPEYGIALLGFVDERPKPRRDSVDALAMLGPPSELPALVEEHGIERVVIAFTDEDHDETLDLIRELGRQGIQIDIVPRMFEILGARASLHSVEGLPLVGLSVPRLPRSSRLVKRAMDIVMASIGLLVVSPLLAAIAIWIRLDSRGPAFFRQERVGANDEPFRILKFRTMTVDAEACKAEIAHLNMHRDGDPRMFKVPDDPRITRAGRTLRRYSLDELPQLFNVLVGDMSLVGPRPLIRDEDCWVADWARRRLELRPGVTGLWQVLGASDIPFGEMTKLDYLYVTNWSLWGDLRIVLHTLPALLRSRNAY